MKILVFIEGTVLVHGSAKGKSREEIMEQSSQFGIQMEGKKLRFEETASYGTDPGGIHNYLGYIPIGRAAAKIGKWSKQGATVYYLSSRRVKDEYGFPDYRNFLFRRQGEEYKDVAENLMPDVLIEDDCESIGGEKEMTYTNISPEAKKKIHHIPVKEFIGIGHLPNELAQLASY